MMKSIASIVLLVSTTIISLSNAHMCLVYPPQRGPFNITLGGDQSCLQTTGPCGTEPAEQPNLVAIAGTTINVLIQQNFNHYANGNPGFLEVSFAPNQNPQESDFQVLQNFYDYWAHNQAQQTNFTVPVTVPMVNCQQCVLRARYIPNKPTEPIFHQCSDIQVVGSSNQFTFPKSFAWRTRGWDSKAELVQFDASGTLKPTGVHSQFHSTHNDKQMKIVNGQLADNSFIANGVTVPYLDSLIFLGGQLGSTSPPTTLYNYNITTGTLSQVGTLPSSTNGSFWCGFVTTPTNNRVLAIELVSINPASYLWAYNIWELNVANGKLGKFWAQTTPSDTFVNFLWASFDTKLNTLYFLSCDEDAAWDWNSQLWTVTPGSATSVVIDNSAYTLSSFFVDQNDHTLKGLSPGLSGMDETFGPNTGFAVVQINPSTGSVTPLVTGLAMDKGHNWSGSIYGNSYGPSQPSGAFLAHRFFSVLDGSTSIGIFLNSAGSPWSLVYDFPIQLGINSEYRLHSLIVSNVY